MKVKISADISKEAKDMLRALAAQHERSYGWLLDRMIKKYCQPEDKPQVKRSEPKRVPSNFDECFERLWIAKGRKGAKQKAKDKFKTYCAGESPEDIEAFTQMLIDDLESRKDELGSAELHLTTYLNEKRWDK